jgi:hypothetical protein
MKKELVYGLIGLVLGAGVMLIWGDKIKSVLGFGGFSSAPAKAK